MNPELAGAEAVGAGAGSAGLTAVELALATENDAGAAFGAGAVAAATCNNGRNLQRLAVFAEHDLSGRPLDSVGVAEHVDGVLEHRVLAAVLVDDHDRLDALGDLRRNFGFVLLLLRSDSRLEVVLRREFGTGGRG